MTLAYPLLVLLISLSFASTQPQIDCRDPDGCEPEEDPCLGRSCGINAFCWPRNGTSECVCNPGYAGDPDVKCTKNVCIGVLCGLNAECHINNGKAECVCKDGLKGDPFRYCVDYSLCNGVRCGPNAECSVKLELDWTLHKQCIIKDPCRDVHCGLNAECRATNGTGECVCRDGFYGDPSSLCTNSTGAACDHAGCGLNAECHVNNGTATCVCRDGFYGYPYSRCTEGVDPCKKKPCKSDEGCISIRSDKYFCIKCGKGGCQNLS